METKPSFWERIGIQDWFLTNNNSGKANTVYALTPDEVYKYIVQKFTDSISQLSFADRIVFYHEFIIILSTEDYRELMNNKQGIFGLIINECVKKFYEILNKYREDGKKVEPSSSKWVFRLVSNPEYVKGDKGFMGKLLPESNKPAKEENLRVTFIPRQTGIAQTFDVSQEVLKDFTYYSEGYYELPYEDRLQFNNDTVKKEEAKTYARLETILPDKQFAGKKVEYLMTGEQIVVSGSEDERNEPNVFKIPSDWVNAPHLQIRFNLADGNLYVASFGEKTMVNEMEIAASDINAPQWTLLPYNSRIILNGIVGINVFKN